MATGSLVMTLEGHSHKITSVAISGNGKSVVTGSYDSTAKVWDMATGSLMTTLEMRSLEQHYSSGVTSVAISRDKWFIVTGTWDNTTKVWDMATGSLRMTLEGHSSGVTSVAISRDGKSIVTGSNDKTAKLWDMATGSLMRTLEGHAGGVTSMAISGHGKSVVTGSYDSTAQVWDMSTGSLIMTLGGHSSDITSVAISEDGSTIVTESKGCKLVWRQEFQQQQHFSSALIANASWAIVRDKISAHPKYCGERFGTGFFYEAEGWIKNAADGGSVVGWVPSDYRDGTVVAANGVIALFNHNGRSLFVKGWI